MRLLITTVLLLMHKSDLFLIVFLLLSRCLLLLLLGDTIRRWGVFKRDLSFLVDALFFTTTSPLISLRSLGDFGFDPCQLLGALGH